MRWFNFLVTLGLLGLFIAGRLTALTLMVTVGGTVALNAMVGLES